MFVKSVDASDYAKTGDKLVELLGTFVEEMGEQNVVQLITDNGSNYVAAGKILTFKRTNMYWTPCAAHCIDLMLEDIGKIPKVDKVMAPLVDVLRMVDNKRKPAMGYIYVAMVVAKESIEKVFNSNSSKYKAVFVIIDKRWECQLHHPLHSAGYYLNPEYYYEKPEIENDPKLIHSKKRNKLEHQRLQNLVFIKYNQALVERFEIRDKIDPMEFGEINYHTQWLVEEMREMGENGDPLQEYLVHEDDDLTWAQVTEASGVNEPVVYTRRSKLLEGASTSRAQQVVVEDVEEDDEDEELEEYFDDI
ncbi:hypothetical protein KIW84_025566 [Lathyrus oleraceus]|uniref:DUF659 domain-containing protein n=1 Tax=Pisum sativum TaxID=3888 RepID=A0A9D5BAX6_PEA|nr:hypothetical protein KIW84_025566 [Pisum sativum]